MTTGERWAGGSREDELLCRLYQHITELQAARCAAGYDIAAGLDRYRAWLAERAAPDQDRREVRPMTWRADPAAGAPLGPVPAEWDAEQAVTVMYSTHYRSLVRLAALLVRDVATAEEVVQDSFLAMHGAWRRLRDNDKALSYLRQSVVNRSRSVLRHRVVVDRNAPKPAPDMPSAEQGALTLLERATVVSALRSLPPRQREALVLRYYGDLSEAQIATAMGISRGAVKSHTARAIASLRAELEMET